MTVAVVPDPGLHRFSTPAKTFAVILLTAVLLAWCFKSGIAALAQAWTQAEYSHGYLIPFIALFIALVRSRPIASTYGSPSRGIAGTWLVICGLLLGAFGTIAAIPDIVAYGLIVSIGGLVINLAGLSGVKQLWPALAYLLFMLPLPNFVYWPLSINLQFVSSEAGVWFIKLLQIPVFLDGNIIDLGIYKLQVAEACSGLRYLFPLMSFGFLFAVLYRGRWWEKLVIFLSTLPITIAMNSARIAVIGVLVNSFGIAQAEGFLHFFEGWIVFMACIVLLYAESYLIRKLFNSGNSADPLFDFGFGDLKSDLSRWASYRAGTPLLASFGVLLACAAAWSLVTTRPIDVSQRALFRDYPMTSGNWSGTRISLEPEIERVLGADDYLFANFKSTEELLPVNLLVSYYNSQTSGSGIHSPAVCIPSGGWEVSNWEQKALTFEKPLQASFDVNRAIIQKGQYRQLVYYWFEQRGRRFTGDYSAKAFTVWDSLVRGRSDGALVRVVTAIEGNDTAGAEARLHRFLEPTLNELPQFVPK